MCVSVSVCVLMILDYNKLLIKRSNIVSLQFASFSSRGSRDRGCVYYIVAHHGITSGSNSYSFFSFSFNRITLTTIVEIGKFISQLRIERNFGTPRDIANSIPSSSQVSIVGSVASPREKIQWHAGNRRDRNRSGSYNHILLPTNGYT